MVFCPYKIKIALKISSNSNTFNDISYIELQYVFDQDPYHVWSAGFEKNPLQGYSIDITTEELDYGFSAIILHHEPL